MLLRLSCVEIQANTKEVILITSLLILRQSYFVFRDMAIQGMLQETRWLKCKLYLLKSKLVLPKYELFFIEVNLNLFFSKSNMYFNIIKI